MLFRSGDNLFEETKVFCSKAEELWMYSPFIRVNKIKDLLENPEKCKAIVVRWQTMDILVGVTDFEKLFEFCQDNNIKLFRNTRIHLKAIRNEKNHVCYGSANFTNMGMGQTGNIELAGLNTDTDVRDIDYLNEILSDSISVDEEYFSALKIDIDEKRRNFKKIEQVKDKDIRTVVNNKFLLDSLPQTDNPEILWEIVNSNFDNNKFNENELQCAKHDIQSYIGINKSISSDKAKFIKQLTLGFNTTPFIHELKFQIRAQANYIMGYTQISEWISKTTLSVPTPSRHDIKDGKWVNRLHDWIPVLDIENYWSEKRYPNGSSLLHYIGKDEGNEYRNLEDLIGGLRINRKGGKSPHQFILLAALNELVKKNIKELSINEIEVEFGSQWLKAGELNSRAKKNFAMPINALEGKLLEFNFRNDSESIQDYRKESELKGKVKSIKIKKSVYELFRREQISLQDILQYY